MISGVSTGGSGLLQAFARVDDVAARTAQLGTDRPAAGDLAQDAVTLVEARAGAAASTAVERATDELHRRLLDIRV